MSYRYKQLIKAYRGLTDVRDFVRTLQVELNKLPITDPRRVLFDSAAGNADDTLWEENGDAAKWLAVRGYDVPEHACEQRELAWACITNSGISSNLCSPRDFGITHHHIRWYAVRGFAG